MPYTSNVGNQLLDAVARRLRAADVPEVEVLDEPITEDQIRPGTYVSPPSRGNGEWEKYRDRRTNEREHIGYGCQVTHVSGSLRPRNERRSDLVDIRQLVVRTFHRKRLSLQDDEMRDSEIVELGCNVEFGAFLSDTDNEESIAGKWDITVLVVRCWIGETGTL